MPRDPSGVFILDTNHNPVAPDKVIESAWANDTLDDIAIGLTNSLDRTSNSQGMQAALKLIDGLEGAPALTFINDDDSGCYRNSADGFIYWVVNGQEIVRFTATTMQYWDSGQWQNPLSEQATEDFVTIATQQDVTADKTFSGNVDFTQPVTLDQAMNSAGEDLIRPYDLGGGETLTAFGNAQSKVSLSSKDANDISHYYNDGANEATILTSDNFMPLILDKLYKIGSIRLTADDVDPGLELGGTWEKISEGRYFAGVGTGSDADDQSGSIVAGQPTKPQDGLYRVSLTEEEMPRHTHFYDVQDAGTGAAGRGIEPWTDPTLTARIGYTGGSSTDDAPSDGDPHQNSPPYYGMYAWRRTA